MPTFNIEECNQCCLLCESCDQPSIRTQNFHVGPVRPGYRTYWIQLMSQSNRAAILRLPHKVESTSNRSVLMCQVPNIRPQSVMCQCRKLYLLYVPSDTSRNIENNVRTVVKSDSHSIDVSQVAASPSILHLKINSVVKNKVISDAPCVFRTTEELVGSTEEEKCTNRKKMPTVIYGKATNTIIRADFRKKTHIYLGEVD